MERTEKILEEILKEYSAYYEIFKPKFTIKHLGYVNDFVLSYENISSPYVVFNIHENMIEFEETHYKEEKVNKFSVELREEEVTLLKEALEEDENK